MRTYIAGVTQTGTNDPAVAIIDNTLIGVPTLTRADVGAYDIVCPGAFAGAVGNSGTFFHQPSGNQCAYTVTWRSDDQMLLKVEDGQGGDIDLDGYGPAILVQVYAP
jgi:hypothetical protein